MSPMRLALAGVVLVLSGCAPSDPTPSTTTDEPSATSSASTTPSSTATQATPTLATEEPNARRGTRVVVSGSDYSPMLYAVDGQAIYLFDLEDGPRPRCYDECAVEWPPVLTTGDPVAARGADAGLLGTVKRRDGSTQVTYAGHPLYFYAHESPYQVLCHDFDEFGGTWFVVRPTGDAAPGGG